MNPATTPRTAITASSTKLAQPADPSTAAVSADSTASIAAAATSHSTNSNTPIATAFRNARPPGARDRTRPTGNPRKIVPPAIAPNTAIVAPPITAPTIAQAYLTGRVCALRFRLVKWSGLASPIILIGPPQTRGPSAGTRPARV